MANWTALSPWWGGLTGAALLSSGVGGDMASSISTAAPHVKDGRFFNPHDPSPHGFSDFLTWQRTRVKPPPWRDLQVEQAPAPTPRLQGDAMRATWVGHSTLLVQTREINLLTDPVWSERCSPIRFAGPRRFAAPGVRFEDLPPIDVVLISHNHYDHLDEATVVRLAKERDPTFFVPLGVGAWMAARGITRVVELDWWQQAPLGPVRVTSVPVQHFSGRGAFDGNKTLWTGWVVEGEVGPFFFAGDTGYSPDFAEIGRRFAPIRLAAVPIGAYAPRWFMGPVHVDPAQAVQIHRDVGARLSVGIHWGTFPLADDPQDEPPRLLREELEKAGLDPAAFQVLPHGGALDVPPLPSPGAP